MANKMNLAIQKQWESILNDQDSDVFLLRRYDDLKKNPDPSLGLVRAIEKELQSRGWHLDNNKNWSWEKNNERNTI